MGKQTSSAIRFVIIMTVLTGLIYVLIITGIGQLFFHRKANGSLLVRNGKIIGSELIAQKFDSSIYFWPRPSSISYNPVPSGASNYGPTNDTLKKQVNSRRKIFSDLNSLPDTVNVPKEMITSSASGLDPHISVTSALLQVDRVVKGRKFTETQMEQLLKLIKAHTEAPQFHLLGEPRINVFLLNLDLDKIK